MSTVHHYEGPLVGSGASETVELVSSGEAVLHFIQVSYDDARTVSTSTEVSVRDADDTVLHLFEMDFTANRTLRNGLYCGPWGLRSTNGLKVRITNQDASNSGVKFSFLHGVGCGGSVSAPMPFTATGHSSHSIRSAGSKGVLHFINMAGTNADVVMELREQNGNVLAVWQGDGTSEAQKRSGYYCGPWGMRFRDGLVVELKDNGGGGGTTTVTATIEDTY